MGLIKAVTSTVTSTIAEMWEDYIYCDSMSNDILIQKGIARKAGGNEKAGGNVITDGSRIAVNAGQFMIIVENGKIIDFTAEEGGYIYDTKTEPSLFCGSFKDGLKEAVNTIKERFKFGGQPANDQRVYYINTKEILDNKFGFGNIPFRDNEFNISIMLQGFGVYSFRIINPLIFYRNIGANVADSYSKGLLAGQMRTELQGALMPVLGTISQNGMRYDSLPQESQRILQELKSQLNEEWNVGRGIEMTVITFQSIAPDDESRDKIREFQESRVYAADHNMLGARIGAAQANAMEDAAKNPGGAVGAVAGVGMISNNMGVNAGELLKQPSKPQPQEKWTCECGNINEYPFCPMCGRPKPEKNPYVCEHCGTDWSFMEKQPKFCPSCGKPMA